MSANPCIFCNIWREKRDSIVLSNRHCFAMFDKYPVSKGHMLIIPKRNVSSFFQLELDEVVDAYLLLQEAKKLLDERFKPAGYNIGVNIGGAAGQTVWHVHIHLIPRYRGDVENPTGGIRNIFPDKGDYTKML